MKLQRHPTFPKTETGCLPSKAATDCSQQKAGLTWHGCQARSDYRWVLSVALVLPQPCLNASESPTIVVAIVTPEIWLLTNVWNVLACFCGCKAVAEVFTKLILRTYGQLAEYFFVKAARLQRRTECRWSHGSLSNLSTHIGELGLLGYILTVTSLF